MRFSDAALSSRVVDTITPSLQKIYKAIPSPPGIHCTHDIRSAAGKKAIIDAAIACEKEGAEVIALASTGMATTNIAKLVAPCTALPVINPVLALGKKLL